MQLIKYLENIHVSPLITIYVSSQMLEMFRFLSSAFLKYWCKVVLIRIIY